MSDEDYVVHMEELGDMDEDDLSPEQKDDLKVFRRCASIDLASRHDTDFGDSPATSATRRAMRPSSVLSRVS